MERIAVSLLCHAGLEVSRHFHHHGLVCEYRRRKALWWGVGPAASLGGAGGRPPPRLTAAASCEHKRETCLDSDYSRARVDRRAIRDGSSSLVRFRLCTVHGFLTFA